MNYLDKPRLRHCTIVADPAQASVTLVVGRKHLELEHEAGARDDFLALKGYFDGHHTIREMGDATSIDPADVLGVAQAFEEAGLLQTRTSAPRIPLGDFLERVEDTSIMWRRQIGLHRLFGGLEEGIYRREALLGLLLETYHYVRLLSPTLAQVAESWDDSPAKQVVLEYAYEEMEHHRDYEATLDTVPRLRGRIASSHPTVTTLSLIRNFESIGRRSSLSLVCCLQMIEARASEADHGEAHLRKIARVYGLDELIDPFVKHMRADLGLEHSSLLMKSLAGTSDVAAAAAHESVNDMHDIKHCFDEFHDGIIKYYADISNYIPRPKVDYFAL